ncbi:MAG: hypothetical protein CM1200mP29_05530 [Verrucomicrobiota bacterium]|nr:MAG: hypothetical protein CM1200mP29_05530 [Verrucomicrobiota bacterium]
MEGRVCFHSAGGDVGELITKPFALGNLAERLPLNYQTKKGVPSEWPSNSRMAGDRGYTLAACNPLKGDSLQQDVAWQAGGDISHLRRKYPVAV